MEYANGRNRSAGVVEWDEGWRSLERQSSLYDNRPTPARGPDRAMVAGADSVRPRGLSDELHKNGGVKNGGIKNGVIKNRLLPWLAARFRRLLFRLGQKAARRDAGLGIIERVMLGPRQTLALVEAQGIRLLVATSADGTPAFFALPLRVPGGETDPERDGHSPNRNLERVSSIRVHSTGRSSLSAPISFPAATNLKPPASRVPCRTGAEGRVSW